MAKQPGIPTTQNPDDLVTPPIHGSTPADFGQTKYILPATGAKAVDTLSDTRGDGQRGGGTT